MITQETYLTAFIESIQITAERLIQISQYDKTIQATIKSQDKDNKKLYYVSSYGCPNFSVLTLDNDNTTYIIGDEVYVNLPNGEYTSSDKYIIGKVTKIQPEVIVKTIDNILVPNGYSIINNFPYYNSKRYQTLIIEFESYIDFDQKNGLGIEENIFPFVLSADTRKDLKTININNLWSTKNMYGNIFDSNFPSIQRIIIKGLDNFTNINLSWDANFLQDTTVKVLGLNSKILGNGVLKIQNLKYYFGYDIEELNKNSIYNASILLSEEGEKIFYKDNNIWALLTDINSLNSQDTDYRWEITWYDYNPLQINYTSYNNPVPQYWVKMENRPETYRKKLVLLQQENLVSYSQSKKSLYSILE